MLIGKCTAKLVRRREAAEATTENQDLCQGADYVKSEGPEPDTRVVRRPFPYRRRAPILATPIIIVVALFLLRSGYRAAFAGRDPASRAVKAQIEASKRQDCAKVFDLYTARTQQLMMHGPLPRVPMTREFAVRSYCSYATEGDLGDYLPDKIRRIQGDDHRAIVGATYKYDRFFGFFGEGKSEARVIVLKEGNAWRIDHTEEIDPNSRTNLDRKAMSNLHQLYTAERQLFMRTGTFSTEFARIQEELPGFPFPPIQIGVAARNSPAGTLYVQPGSRKNLICISTKSGTGTLAMIKEYESKSRSMTYRYGSTIPRKCDSEPLARPYHGVSSGIE